MTVTALNFLELPTQKPRISFAIDEQLKQELEAQADVESRTVSNLVLLAVREYLEKTKSDRTKGKKS
ncbi:hypothetical protein V2H45_22225 [Tumidithrix elongata RA019]|uniref:CopG-like ribbon-helix-helix domain-containing protein n=1 Tax=Tumidithrix elongata BACA0141 TaxID=2716417 RepID=A0AAW9PWR6_9CYAN|nr:hypothetical protein [Tumidithrix elongata RA019]